jgi:hypothetical protein
MELKASTAKRTHGTRVSSVNAVSAGLVKITIKGSPFRN